MQKLHPITNTGAQAGRYVMKPHHAKGTLTVDRLLGILLMFDTMSFPNFDAYKKTRESVHIITPVPAHRAPNFVGPFTCDCNAFLKKLHCKHSIGLALKL
jgi:hypothetical protein